MVSQVGTLGDVQIRRVVPLAFRARGPGALFKTGIAWDIRAVSRRSRRRPRDAGVLGIVGDGLGSGGRRRVFLPPVADLPLLLVVTAVEMVVDVVEPLGPGVDALLLDLNDLLAEAAPETGVAVPPYAARLELPVQGCLVLDVVT